MNAAGKEPMDIKEIYLRQRSLVMGLSMLAIMLFHQNWENSDPVSKLFHLYGYLGVDLFMFLSGMGICLSLQKNSIKDFFVHRVKRMLPVCLVVGAIKLLVDFVQGNETDWVMALRILTGTNLWFIAAIWIFYLCSPLFYALMRRWSILLIAVSILLALVSQFEVPDFHFNLGASRLPIYLLGMAVGMKSSVMIGRKWLMASCVYLLCFICYIIGQRVHVIPFIAWALNFMPFIPCLPALALFFNWVGRYRIEVVRWIGTITLELYLWHEYLFAQLYRYDGMNGYVMLFFALQLSIIVAYLTARLMSKVPTGRA